MSAPKIKACLFDMDGLLLNTEDIYTEAATAVLATYGAGPMTWDIKLDLQGRPGAEATARLLRHYKLDVDADVFLQQAFDVQQGLWPKSAFLPGARELLRDLQAQNVPVALGTGSNTVNFQMKTAHLDGAFDVFKHHIVTGDDPRIAGRGKPLPDVWLTCLASLNAERQEQGQEPIRIDECLVFEDGVPGVESARAAGATVVWVPHPEALKELAGREVGVLGDGGEMISSLTAFDKAKYGL